MEKVKKIFSAIISFLSTLFSKLAAPFKRRKRKSGKEKNAEDVNWGKAVRHSLGIITRIVLRVISYIINVIATVLLVGLITGFIVGIVFILYLKSNINPQFDVEVYKTDLDATSKFFYYDESGAAIELENERIHGSENRIWCSIAEMPENLKEAFIAIEDHRFWDHKGVDWYRTAGAVMNFFLPSESTFGGSTITQQLIKNLSQEDEVTIQRKVQEIFRALYVEKQISKTEILETYLNTIYLSQGCSGVKTAAYTYFGKDVSQLTLVECAALASITKYPTKFDPVQHPDNNRDRRNTVLKTMLQYGKITQEEFNEAFDAELVLNLQQEQTNNATNVSSYYVDAAIEDIIADLMEQRGIPRSVASNMLFSGGVNIYLAMDPKVQQVLEECFLDEDTFPTDDYVIKPQSAMVICDPYSGDILGIVGGRGEKTMSRGWNYATQARRSPGSSIKPLSVYGPAIDLGLITYGTVVDDIPYSIVNNVDWPKNNSRTYQGLKNIAYAIEVSLNTTAVRVLNMIGVQRSYEFTQKLGLYNIEESYTTSSGVSMTDVDIAPLALGATTVGVTVREMASAYTTFPNGGIHNKSRTYYKVTDSDGNTILDNKPQSENVFSESTAAIMTKLLGNVVANRGINLTKYVPVAGKTGTSMDEYDKWFCGYTPYYVGAVWYGFDQPKTLPLFRIFAPLYIFDNVMMRLHADIIEDIQAGGEAEQFPQNVQLTTRTVCASSGKLYNPSTCGCDPRGNQAQTCYYARGTEPVDYCDRHILVDFCRTSGQVASVYCTDKVQHALVLETERSFPVYCYIVDAQYIYRPLAAGVSPYVSSQNPQYPFFQNMLSPGEYIGVTNLKRNTYACNAYCPIHITGPIPPATEGGDEGEQTTPDTQQPPEYEQTE